MQRLFIISTNCMLLALLLIGLPAATHAQLGDWQITSAGVTRQLLFCGLAIGIAGNMVGGLVIAKGRKGKILCWEWAAVFTGLFVIYWAFIRNDINFHWLKCTLLWLQDHL